MKDAAFSCARLLALYDRISDAEDAIPRLRRLVLDLAVRGKLVEQDASDEPAAELLKRMVSERNARVKSGQIRKGKPNDPIDAAPWDAPSGWVWLPLGDTGNIFIGNSINAVTRERLEKTNAGHPFTATKDVGYGLDPINYDNGLLVSTSDESFKVARAQSILICAEGGSAGRKIGITDREICFGNKLLANETWSGVSPRYVLFVYQSSFFYEQFAKQMTGIISGISINKFQQLPFPLPPLAEQRRIVAKVDELMALCDQLELARAGREATRDRLTTASLARLTAPDTDAEAFESHARFALQSLRTLTTRPDQIKTLRQTILNLAVRGKLVEQEASDEPAAALQNELRKSKEDLLKSRTIRNQKVTTTPIDAEVTFEIPKLWKWVRLGELVSLLGGYAYKSATYVPKEGNQIIRLGNVKNDEVLHYQRPAYISNEIARQTADFEILKDDILVTMTGTKGKRDFVFTARVKDSDLTQGRLFLNQRVGAIRPFNSDIVPLINLFLKSDILLDWIFETATGTANQANIGVSSILDLPFPLPPLAEQHRIVAKVDALMALCDQLEASLTTTATTRARLLEALLHEALEPGTSDMEAA
jgi:type I restriction enzyme, S subunit